MKRTTYKSYKGVENVLNNNLSARGSNTTLDSMNYATTKEMVTLLGDDSIERSFTLCCKMGLTDMVQMMLDKGADPTVDNFNAFRFASEQGHDEVLELLINSISVTDFKKELKECLVLATDYSRKYCILLLNKALSC